jgi:type I restriction enzyme M protein
MARIDDAVIEEGRPTGEPRRRNGRPGGRRTRQEALPIDADSHLDISALETWLWDAACAIRGATDAP